MLLKQLPRFPKARTNSRETSCESWLLSTVPSVMMRIRLVRTVAKLDIASTIVPSSGTLPPTSSVASVAMLAIWLVIVLTAREVPTGGMAAVMAVAAEPSGKAMLSTVRWSNLCKNCPVVLQAQTASLLAGSRLVPITVTMIVT